MTRKKTDLGCKLNDGDAQGWTRYTRATAVWHYRSLSRREYAEGTRNRREDMLVQL